MSGDDDSSSDTRPPFEEWAVVELFGHQRIAGRVSEQTIGAAAMIRVDVPDTPGRKGYTKFYGNGAIYGITPTSADVAIAAATQIERYHTPMPYVPPARQIAGDVAGYDHEDAG